MVCGRVLVAAGSLGETLKKVAREDGDVYTWSTVRLRAAPPVWSQHLDARHARARNDCVTGDHRNVRLAAGSASAAQRSAGAGRGGAGQGWCAVLLQPRLGGQGWSAHR